MPETTNDTELVPFVRRPMDPTSAELRTELVQAGLSAVIGHIAEEALLSDTPITDSHIQSIAPIIDYGAEDPFWASDHLLHVTGQALKRTQLVAKTIEALTRLIEESGFVEELIELFNAADFTVPGCSDHDTCKLTEHQDGTDCHDTFPAVVAVREQVEEAARVAGVTVWSSEELPE